MSCHEVVSHFDAHQLTSSLLWSNTCGILVDYFSQGTWALTIWILKGPKQMLVGSSFEIQYEFSDRPIAQIPQCASPYLTMHHFVTEMCTFSVKNGALWDICLVQCGICEITQFGRFIGPSGEILQGSCFRKLQAHEKIFYFIAWWAGGLRKLSRWGGQRLISIKWQCPRSPTLCEGDR